MTAAGERTIAERIAKLAADAGGRAYYVGGCVRDVLMGRESKDLDVEVHGLKPAVLWGILEQVGEPTAHGKSFGVYGLRHTGLDIAMPRKERQVGTGHRGFEVDVDPFLGPKEAARRRDFTVNAFMQDVLTGEVLDFYGGRKDLDAGVLRCVDENHFGEDPLRVLRAAQFAARFGFTVEPKTVVICASIDLTQLSRERIEEELKKALLQADRPSVFFEVLREMRQLSPWFAEAEALIGVPQDPHFHPEGDVWVHTMEVLDRAASLRGEAENPYAFMLLALCHDFGKAVTTAEKNGRIHAYGHETEGLPLVDAFLQRVCGEVEVRRYVRSMLPLHMRPNLAAWSKPSVKSTNHLFDEAVSPADLILFAQADRPVFAGSEEFSGDGAFLRERLEIYRETMNRPFVEGKDLVAAGVTPGPAFTELLAFAHKLRLAGIEKEPALKQTLAMARKLCKK
jgi:tRNA nucleotidyltransferase (CCA-adding enzyme)